MNPNDVRAATTEAVRAADQLAAHLERLAARLGDRFPVEPASLTAWDDDAWERLHAFLRMFEQLYDLTARKLFRGLLVLSGETIAGLSAQNQFRRVEALAGIGSADRWIELGATRNILAHDYPTDPAARAQRANRAWHDHGDLIAGTRSAIARLHAERLLG